MSSEAYYAREKRYIDAIKVFHEGWYVDAAKCARAFEVTAKVLRDRLHEKTSKSTRIAPNKRLTEAQEQVVKNYVKRLDDQNMSLTSKLVVDVVNYILQMKNLDALSLDSDWFKRFFARNSMLKKRWQRPIATDRKDAFNVQDLENYFKKLKITRDEFDILNLNIWNMNKTSFRVDCDKSRIVITLDVNKNIRMTDLDNRDYITTIKVVFAEEDTISSLLILKGAHILHKWTLSNDLDEETLLSISDFEYSNNDLAMNWLHHFVKHTKSKRIDRWILLIIDDFESHMIFPFLKLVIANNIKLFKLSSHFTHLTQSLDVDVFQSYKHHHDQAIENVVRHEDTKFNRLEFLTTFRSFRERIFKTYTIRHVFRRCDIVPFDFSVVINSMKFKRAAKKVALELTTSKSIDSDECFQRISRESQSLKKNTKALRSYYEENDDFVVDAKQMHRFLKAIDTQFEALKLRSRDLDHCLKVFVKRD